MDFKYKIGQAVRVRPDLIGKINKFHKMYKMTSGPKVGDARFVLDKMFPFTGKTVHILDYTWDGVYRVSEISDCVWTDEMFMDEPCDECICEMIL